MYARELMRMRIILMAVMVKNSPAFSTPMDRPYRLANEITKPNTGLIMNTGMAPESARGSNTRLSPRSAGAFPSLALPVAVAAFSPTAGVSPAAAATSRSARSRSQRRR